jgi:hypothetical protein
VTEVSKEASGGTQKSRGLWADFGVLAAVLPIGLAALRIVVYSGGDPTLMRVLIQTLNITTLLLGTVLPVLPMLFLLALQPLIADMSLARTLVSRGASRRRWWLLLILVLPVLYLLVGPWPTTLRTFGYGAGALALGVIVVWIIGVHRARRSHAPWRQALKVRVTFAKLPPVGRSSHVFLAPVFVVAVVLFMPQGSWLPLESIQVDQKQVDGYVLQIEDWWATLLTKDRVVERYPADLVTDRQVCDQGNYRSLATMISGVSGTVRTAC